MLGWIIFLVFVVIIGIGIWWLVYSWKSFWTNPFHITIGSSAPTLTTCNTDANCPPENYCSMGTCVPLGTCITTADCAYQFLPGVCLNNQCVCQHNSDCLLGQWCNQGQCVSQCTTNDQCRTDTTAETTACIQGQTFGSCTPKECSPLRQDYGCGAGETCVFSGVAGPTTTGVCVPLTPTSTNVCYGLGNLGYKSLYSTASTTPECYQCLTSSDCPIQTMSSTPGQLDQAYQHCVQGACSAFGTTCAPNQVAVGSICCPSGYGQTCTSTSDCPNGYCVGTTCSCVASQPGAPCTSTGDCSWGLNCMSGACRSGTLLSCSSSDPCHSGFCVNDYCTSTPGVYGSGCIQDTDCGSELVCCNASGQYPCGSFAEVGTCVPVSWYSSVPGFYV